MAGRKRKDGHPWLSSNHGVRDPEIRFARAVREGDVPPFPKDTGPCLDYIGADNGNGYGQFRYNGTNGYAHRYAWERINGPIPDGMTIDHLCRNRRCCNVDHLEVVTRDENYRRAVRSWTTCPNGHEYPDRNAGKRRCKICEEATWRRGWAKRARIANGLPDRRLKYDQDELRRYIALAANREMSVADAARAMGCGAKYMDKRVREFRRRNGEV